MVSIVCLVLRAIGNEDISVSVTVSTLGKECRAGGGAGASGLFPGCGLCLRDSVPMNLSLGQKIQLLNSAKFSTV